MNRSIAALLELGSLFVAACSPPTSIVVGLMERQVAAILGSNLLDELPDGLYVALCGAGSPLPDPKRSGPCTAVVAGKQLIVVDAGSGSSRVFNAMRIPQGRIDALLLTHLHSDHIDGLGELELQRWAGGGHAEPLPIYGPEGTEDVVEGINLAYRHSRRYRVAHHGEDVVPTTGAGAIARTFASPKDGEALVVLERDGLTVTAFRVDHEPVSPAVGYRFEYGGRSVVISGDTKASPNLRAFAEGADLLVHEALAAHLVQVMTDSAEQAGNARLAKITHDILDYHTTPVEAAEIARDAGVGWLLFNHIVPPLPLDVLEGAFVEGVDDVYDGPFTVGRDGTFVRLVTGGDDIEVEELL